MTAQGKVPVTQCPFILVPLPSGEHSVAAHCHKLLWLPLIVLLPFPFLSPHFFFGSDTNLRCFKTLQEALGRQPTLTPSLLSYEMWLFAVSSHFLTLAELFWSKLLALILTSLPALLAPLLSWTSCGHPEEFSLLPILSKSMDPVLP